MFCTKLRRRSSCSGLLPVITAKKPSGLALREREIATHDLQVSLPSPTGTKDTQLCVNIITPSCTTEANTPGTVARLEHFAVLTGAVDVVMIYFMTPAHHLHESPVSPNNNGINGLLQLQKILLDRPDLPHLPILPLTAAQDLPQLLQSFMHGRLQPGAATEKSSNQVTPTGLLGLCSAHPPLSQDVLFVLTDLFSDLRELALASLSCTIPSTHSLQRSSQGPANLSSKLQTLAALVGDEQTMDIVNFWRTEWIDDICC